MAKPLIFVALLCIALALPVCADQTVVVHVPDKQPFSVKHPRLHKYGRKLRRVCQLLQPVLSATASSAQIATPFVFHR